MKPWLGCFLLLSSFSLVLASIQGANAQDTDWPQWRGADRDGHAADQDLRQSWPKKGPKLKWTFDKAEEGFSTMAVADGKLYTMGADEDNCFVICLNSENGKLIWKTPIARASKRRDYNQQWGEGPRGTPTVDGDHVFAMTDLGVVVSLDKQSGKLSWSVDLVDVYKCDVPRWGYSESPLVDGDRVIVTPGGEKFMVALDRESGDEVWHTKGFDEPAQYVSAILGQAADTRFYLTAAQSGLIAFDSQSGEVAFSDDMTGNDVAVVSTPILHDDWVYHTSDYGAGNTLLKLTPKADGGIRAKSLYHLAGKTMRNHHGGVVLGDGVSYGFTKVDGGVWMAQDLETGETLWRERVGRNRSGSISYADGRLYCYNDTDGTCYLVQPSREQWEPRGMLTLPEQTKMDRDKGAIWATPIIADGTLYLRDQDLIFAFDISAKR